MTLPKIIRRLRIEHSVGYTLGDTDRYVFSFVVSTNFSQTGSSLLQVIFAIVLAVSIFAGMGWLMVHSLKWARNRDGHTQIAMGHALQELDRLVARPSIENKINTETEVQSVDDEHGGK